MALTKISRSLLDTGISDSSDATAITIDSSENVFVGSGTSNGISDGTSGLQVSGAGFKGTISASRHDNNAYGSALMLGKSRNTTVGSNTIVQNGDAIGAIGFFADDGTNLDSQVAYITASVDGAPGANDTPGRLTFSTTSDGAASVSERVRIDSNGDFLVRQTSSAVYDTNSGADVRQFWGNQFSGANNTNSKVIIGSATALPLVGGATLNASSKFIVNSYIGFGSSDQTAGGEDGYMAFYTSSGGAAGVEKMRITDNGFTKHSNTGTYDSYSGADDSHQFVANNTGHATVWITNTNTAYDFSMIRAESNRTPNSGFTFLTATTGNLTDDQFKLRGDGEALADGSFIGGGADYAEYFEWVDGNTSNEDRRGYSVVLDNNKIRKATDSDNASDIIGVISGNPSVVGDSSWSGWNNKYLKDDYGSYILDENGDRTLNTEYDETQTYISREDRQEWDIVGLMGKVRINKNQPVGDRWIKMRDISDTVEEWFIK